MRPNTQLLGNAIVWLALIAAASVVSRVRADDAAALSLKLRSRVETSAGSGRWHTLTKPADWAPAKTAVVICDMWDKHWCDEATKRVGEMAPRMNEFVSALRKQGVFVIHCPSDVVDYYKDTPQRKRAQAAPPVETKVPLERWRKLDPAREAPLPIDDSDGGCDDAKPVASHRAWSRQHPAIEVHDEDAITDSVEAYYLMRQRGIVNVLVLGVHANMCVLGRPFSIRQMSLQGMNVALVRDLTDAMYNPARAPYVSHFTGTDLIVEHIEKYWCPSCTSADVLGGEPFKFAADERPHVVIVTAEDEYKTEQTLPAWALTHLGKEFRVSIVYGDDANRNTLPGVEQVGEADVLLVSVRRRPLPADQLAYFRKHVANGKPVVGIRTASHAFSPLKDMLPEGTTAWPEFDHDVLGGNYNGHFGAVANGASSLVRIAPGDESNPLLAGVKQAEFGASSTLYRVTPLAEGAHPLLLGSLPDGQSEQPVAWTFTRADGGRSFYTSLGASGDFEKPAFPQLLKNAVSWAAESLKSEKKAAVK